MFSQVTMSGFTQIRSAKTPSFALQLLYRHNWFYFNLIDAFYIINRITFLSVMTQSDQNMLTLYTYHMNEHHFFSLQAASLKSINIHESTKNLFNKMLFITSEKYRT